MQISMDQHKDKNQRVQDAGVCAQEAGVYGRRGGCIVRMEVYLGIFLSCSLLSSLELSDTKVCEP